MKDSYKISFVSYLILGLIVQIYRIKYFFIPEYLKFFKINFYSNFIHFSSIFNKNSVILVLTRNLKHKFLKTKNTLNHKIFHKPGKH